MIPNCMSYKSLLKSAVDSILNDRESYSEFMVMSDDAEKDLKIYLTDKKYTLPTGTLDLIISALAKETLCTIIVYYLENQSLRQHRFEPLNHTSSEEVEIIFQNGHYDVVTSLDSEYRQGDITKHSQILSVVIPDSPEKARTNNQQVLTSIKREVLFGNLKTEVQFQKNNEVLDSEYRPENLTNHSQISPIAITDSPEKSRAINQQVNTSMVKREVSFGEFQKNSATQITLNIESDSDIDTEEAFEDERSVLNIVSYRGSKKYVNPEIFGAIIPKPCSSVPENIDGLEIYKVPIQETLRNCKGLRPWCPAQSSKTSQWTSGPRLIMNCRGSYLCTNNSCPNIADYGINRTDFCEKKKEVRTLGEAKVIIVIAQ